MMKKRIIILASIVIVGVVAIAVLYPREDRKEDAVCDTTALLGGYEGEATLDIPEKIKSMAKDAEGNSLVPDGPVPCTVAIKAGEAGKVSIELVGFQMPVEGIELKPVPCGVTLLDGMYNLSGDGKIDYGGQKFSYSHSGRMKDMELELNATLVILPFVLEPKVVFKGKRKAH